ncbi:hypothetical protein PVX_106215 [Plasmodium vivax]|uniref:VIR protein n=1 Tax=Plasmodium vivax (strain Salvador I) TaxID=126793 RepID=A5KCU4_PLAVS|nr:hypothetical protein PVX_106215 [Plasmodium vivax]EDL42825.1 hypothetical protein PVX_106215 [Plasmodium vivax]|eukprot:XP_001608557.1 hypothetical protein [Plasmodium vivax Sal-1]
MSGRPRMSSSGTDFAKRFREFRCIDNYNTFKTEIERKIDDFRSRTKKKFCKECDIIKNLIYQKKNELYSYCDNKSFPNRLIETNDKIKVFIIQCPDLSKCSDNHAPNARKSVAAGKPQLYSCNNGGCVTGRETQLQKDSKAKPEIQRASSEIRGSEGPKALEKNLNPEATAELQKKNVIIPAKHSFTHPGSSAGSDTETPEPKVNTHSRITGHEDTQTHPISLSVPSSAMSLLDNLVKVSVLKKRCLLKAINKILHMLNKMLIYVLFVIQMFLEQLYIIKVLTLKIFIMFLLLIQLIVFQMQFLKEIMIKLLLILLQMEKNMVVKLLL